MRVTVYTSFDELPSRYDRLFAETSAISYFETRAWFECLVATTSDDGDELRLYGVEPDAPDGTPLGLYVMRVPGRKEGVGAGRVLSGFENFYTIQSGPLLAPSAPDKRAVLASLVQAFAADRPRWDVLSLRMLDGSSDVFETLVALLRDAGFVVHTYFQYGNWFETPESPGYEGYMARRGKTIRQTLAWKARKVDRMEEARYSFVSGADGVETAIRDYERVYKASWKGGEDYPDFMPSVIRACAADGSLRLGTLYLDDKPVASRFTIVWADQAIMYKSAYDETAPKNLSLGGVLTLAMLQRVLDDDGVRLIDYGIGDEAYKTQWMSSRRERWGIMAFNRATPAGAMAALRHKVGPAIKAATRRLTKQEASES